VTACGQRTAGAIEFADNLTPTVIATRTTPAATATLHLATATPAVVTATVAAPTATVLAGVSGVLVNSGSPAGPSFASPFLTGNASALVRSGNYAVEAQIAADATSGGGFGVYIRRASPPVVNVGVYAISGCTRSRSDSASAARRAESPVACGTSLPSAVRCECRGL
jgi:hypothetical protein